MEKTDSTDKTSEKKATVADKIWEEIKNVRLDMFSLPDFQQISINAFIISSAIFSQLIMPSFCNDEN